MTARRAYFWGAALIGAAVVVLAWRAAPAPLPVAAALYLAAFAALLGLVLHWGLQVYGPAGGLGALALCAFAPTLWQAQPRLLPIMAEAAAAYALVRCQLDPTVQWVLAVAAAAGSALLFSALAWTPVEVRLACFALLLVVARTVTAEPWERRARVAQAGLVSVGLAAALLLAFGAVLSRLSTLPTVDDFSRAVDALRVAAAGPVAADGPWRIVPVPLLLLAALRPWRALRRYSDAGWLLALACLALPFGNEGGGWAVATPFLALLAGAGWDATRPLAWRRAATALVVLYVILSLVSEPAPTPETLPAPALAAARGMAPA